MRLGLDDYAYLDSPLHRWEPRCKLIGLMALVFAFSQVQNLGLLPPMLVMAALLLAMSKLPIAFWLSRLRAPGAFLLIMVVLLPVISGVTIIGRVGPLAVRLEGCVQAGLLSAKFVAIVTTGLVLFGTAPFLTSVKAMRALGLPSLLADMTLFSYRYIHVIGQDLETMEIAMRLRGLRQHRLGNRVLTVLSSLAGSILVRSYERSERVHKAMLLRGYGRAPRVRCETRIGGGDILGLILALSAAAGLVVLDMLHQGSGG